MSLFGNLDVANAKDPNFIEPNTYEGFITKAEVKVNEEKETTNLVLTCTIDGGEYDGKSVLQYQRIPQEDTPKDDDERAAGFLKMLLGNLGVPEDRMNDVELTDLQGLPVTFGVVQNGAYQNIRNLKAREEDAGGASPWN